MTLPFRIWVKIVNIYKFRGINELIGFIKQENHNIINYLYKTHKSLVFLLNNLVLIYSYPVF